MGKNMTHHKVMQQALDALRVATTPLAQDRQEVLSAIKALTKALALPDVQPVTALEPTLSQYQEYNGEWCDFIDEQHYLDTVAKGNCRVRALYAAPQPVNAPAWVMLTSDEIETLALQEKFWTSSDTPNVFAWSEFAEAVQINMVAKQGGAA